jgi:hypothetical protein
VSVNNVKVVGNNQNVRVSSDATSNVNGQANVIMGVYNGNPSGNDNVMIGKGAGSQSTIATANVFIGSGASNSNTDGSNNVSIGNNAGNGTNGSNNTFIGSYSGTGIIAPNSINNTCIGNGAVLSSSSASYEITLGGTITTALRCAQTSITSLSDARDKKEIEELPVGLEFVKGLKPVKFVWDERSEEGRHNIKDFGFIAQDLKASQEEIEMEETLKLVYESNPEKLEASYGKLIPILVKAIQELSEEVKQLKNK